MDFCSLKIAEALAQPPHVVQYLPVTLECDGEAAIAKRDRVANILTHQPTIDLRHSDHDFKSWAFSSGKTELFGMTNLRKFVLCENFEPKTEIFRVEEDPGRILAVDTLAERVLKAGCTGIEFRHFETPDYCYTEGVPITIRTARGTKIVTR